MARVGFTKITPIKTIEDKTIELNGETINIKQYLPMEKKSEMIGKIIGDVLDTTGLSSPLREIIYRSIYVIAYYTNINLTENMINEASKTYDLLVLNHIIDKVIEEIPEVEYQFICNSVHTIIEMLVTYRTSAAGLMEYMAQNQNQEMKDVDSINDTLNALSENKMLKEVLEKMG